MSTMNTLIRATEDLPDLKQFAHWPLRLMLAAIILDQGFAKVPLAASDAASYGVPVLMWAMAAFGEIAAGLLLILGGFIRNPTGDIMTRLGALMLTVIVLSVIVWVYWAPPAILFLSNQIQLLLLVGGLYFTFRGNAA